ncbi:hypothetical protein IID23_02240 [Patescibacteria group bacterium]|nr:hypothetical protein [Patescibacteria group bacterium]
MSKPSGSDLKRIWALTGTKVDPDTVQAGKMAEGWNQEIPPFEFMNFIQNLVAAYVDHSNVEGIAIWDTETTYNLASLAKASDGVVYKSLIGSNLNNNPNAGGSPSEWEIFDQSVLIGGVPVAGWLVDMFTNTQQLVPGEDANTITLSGLYRFTGPSHASIPFTGGGGVLHLTISPTDNNVNAAVQIAFSENGGQFYLRPFTSSTWQPWIQMLFRKDYGIGTQLLDETAPSITTLNTVAGANGRSGLFAGATGIAGHPDTGDIVVLQTATRVTNAGAQFSFSQETRQGADQNKPRAWMRTIQAGVHDPIWVEILTRGFQGYATHSINDGRPTFTDADDIRNAGNYAFDGNESNLPAAIGVTEGGLQHIAAGTTLGGAFQVVTTTLLAIPRMFIRSSANSTSWGAWIELTTTGILGQKISAICHYNVGSSSIIAETNITSVTDNDVGDFNFNFTSPVSVSAVAVINISQTALVSSGPTHEILALTINTVRIEFRGGSGGGNSDPTQIYLIVVDQ